MPALARRTLTFAATFAVATTLTACGSSGHSSTHTASSATSSTASAASTVAAAADAGDVMFAQMMIPHHEQAVEMADIALAKPSASAQVRELATTIKGAQAPEIATMTGWLNAWSAPVTAGSEMNHNHGMMSEADMTSLRKAEGTAFDEQWLTMMIDHHEGAIAMAQQVLPTTKNADVTTLANAIVTSQQAEIATMKGLL